MTDQLSNDLASLRIQRDAPAAEQGGRTLRAVLGGAGVLLLGGASYFVAIPYLEAKIFRPEVSAAEIALVSPAQSSVELTSTGYVAAESTSKVGPKIAGRIARIQVREGDRVKAGDVIAVLEDAEQRTAHAAARSKVAAAKARVETARANLAEAKLQAERQRALAERGAAPAATAQDLEARVRSLSEAARAAEAEVAAAEAEVKTLAVTLDFATIHAPIAGTVIAKSAEVGEMANPLATTIVELADFTTLIVETDVPEGRLGKVKIGGPCEVVLDAYPGRRYRCETQEIVPRVNRAKATVMVKVKFVDPPEGVLPDMAARVSFLERALDADSMKEPPKLVVPAAAVVEKNGAKVVYVLDGDSARLVPVEVAGPFGSGLELKRGPAAGTRVIKSPPPDLEDGRKVKERNEQ